jgi:tRNA dimethylallyltransferase
MIPREREALHARIAERFDAMLAAGLVDEVRALRSRYRLSAGMPSMRAVGYRQAWDYLEGRTGEAAMRERAVAATRQLAKRQLTWLRSFPELVRLHAGSAQDAAIALDLLLHELR